MSVGQTSSLITVNHGRAATRTDFLGGELLLLALVLDLDDGLVTGLGLDGKGPVLHVSLDLGIGELAANQALGVEDGVVGVLSVDCQYQIFNNSQAQIRRLTMATWFLAASPIRRSESLKATYEGVVRLPWSLEADTNVALAIRLFRCKVVIWFLLRVTHFAIISTRSFCHTPTLTKAFVSFFSGVHPKTAGWTLTKSRWYPSRFLSSSEVSWLMRGRKRQDGARLPTAFPWAMMLASLVYKGREGKSK
jgi:hypothetical protein